MRVLYVDESGDITPLSARDHQSQPVLVIAGIAVREADLDRVTRSWVGLKKRYFPNLLPKSSRPWDWQTAEVKGTHVRTALRSNARREWRHAVGFLDRTVELLDQHEARIASRIWVKRPGGEFNGRAVYTSSVQWLCARFQAALHTSNERGVVVLDSRVPGQNVNVAHSVFTQRFASPGDPYPSLVDVPLFGHSDNHAGLQLADMVSTALLAPIACWTLRGSTDPNAHVRQEYERVAHRFAHSLDALGMHRDGAPGTTRAISISDPVTKRGWKHILDECPPRPAGQLELKPAAGVSNYLEPPDDSA